MTIQEIFQHLKLQHDSLSDEFKRLFHGRGGLFEGWKHITIDSIDEILSVAFYFEIKQEKELLTMLKEYINTSRHTSIVLQKRYLRGSPRDRKSVV